MKVLIYILALFLTSFGILGDCILKSAAARPSPAPYIALVAFIWGSTAIGWFWVFKNIKLVTLGAVFSVMTVVSLALLGVFYYKEQISTIEIFALIMAIISVMILSKFG